MQEEPTHVDIARGAAKAGNAGHWPTVASILVEEVERLEAKAQEATNVMGDAFLLVKFTKDNEFPAEGTPEFFGFTDLCHKLECSLRAAGYETATKGVKCSG